jgi:hypothetical protein
MIAGGGGSTSSDIYAVKVVAQELVKGAVLGSLERMNGLEVPCG